MEDRINIVVVDDHSDLRKALMKNLSLFERVNILFDANDGVELLKYLKSTTEKIDIILLDVDMPNMNGIETVKAVKKNDTSNIKIIMLTVFDDDEKIFEAIKAGACGYLTKDESVGSIYQSVLAALEGGAPMSSIIAQKILHLLRTIEKPETNSVMSADKLEEKFELSKREIEVLSNLSAGYSYKKIADILFISEGTIKKHVDNIYRKLHVNSRTEALNKIRE